jgi:hypothetical protein
VGPDRHKLAATVATAATTVEAAEVAAESFQDSMAVPAAQEALASRLSSASLARAVVQTDS